MWHSAPAAQRRQNYSRNLSARYSTLELALVAPFALAAIPCLLG